MSCEIECSGAESIDGYDSEAYDDGSEIWELTGIHEDTGLVEIHKLDEEAAMVIGSGFSEHSMMATLAKIMAFIHRNSQKSHESNKQVEKVLIKIETKNVVNSYNGNFYLVCQVIGGSINVLGGLIAAGGAKSHELVGKVADVQGYKLITDRSGALTDLGAKNLQNFTRQMSKTTKNVSQPFQVAGAVFDNSAQAMRQEAMGNKQTGDTEVQETGRCSGNEKDATEAQKRLLKDLADGKRNVFGTLAR